MRVWRKLNTNLLLLKLGMCPQMKTHEWHDPWLNGILSRVFRAQNSIRTFEKIVDSFCTPAVHPSVPANSRRSFFAIPFGTIRAHVFYVFMLGSRFLWLPVLFAVRSVSSLAKIGRAMLRPNQIRLPHLSDVSDTGSRSWLLGLLGLLARCLEDLDGFGPRAHSPPATG